MYRDASRLSHGSGEDFFTNGRVLFPPAVAIIQIGPQENSTYSMKGFREELLESRDRLQNRLLNAGHKAEQMGSAEDIVRLHLSRNLAEPKRMQKKLFMQATLTM